MKYSKWNKDEYRSVIIEIDRLMVLQRRPIKSVLMEAQKVLDEDRRRSSFNPPMVTKISKLYDKWIQDGKPGQITAPKTADLDPDHFQVIVLQKPPIIVKEPPDIGQVPTSVLLAVLGERMRLVEETNFLMAGLSEKLEERKRQETSYDRRFDTRPPAEKAKVKGKPVRVCVLGISPDSIKELKEKSANLSVPFELSFRVGGDFAKEMPKQDAFDYTLVTGNHAGKWMQKLKDAGADGLAIQAESTVQSMVQKLYDIASRQPAL